MNAKKKLVSLLLAAVTTCSVSIVPLSSNAAYDWQTGNFAKGTNYTSYHTYYVYKSNPTINVYSYYANGKKSTGNTMQIEVTNMNTGYKIYNGKTISSGGSLKLTGGATRYRIRLKRNWLNKNGKNSAHWAIRTNAKSGYTV